MVDKNRGVEEVWSTPSSALTPLINGWSAISVISGSFTCSVTPSDGTSHTVSQFLSASYQRPYQLHDFVTKTWFYWYDDASENQVRPSTQTFEICWSQYQKMWRSVGEPEIEIHTERLVVWELVMKFIIPIIIQIFPPTPFHRWGTTTCVVMITTVHIAIIRNNIG